MATIKVLKIVAQKPVTTKDGREVVVTKFTTEDGDVVDTFHQDIQAGQSYEGELKETSYGKLFIKERGAQNKKAFVKTTDISVMLLSYAKDIVVALINSGKLNEADVMSTWPMLYRLAKDMYNGGDVDTDNKDVFSEEV